MPSVVTQFGQAAWSGMCFGITAVPAHYYIALATSTPGTSIDGTSLESIEPSASGYGRVAVATDSSHWAVGSSLYLANVNPIVYGNVTADWGIVTHFCICDAATGGNVYAWASATNPQDIGVGVYMFIPAGALTVAVQTVPSV